MVFVLSVGCVALYSKREELKGRNCNQHLLVWNLELVYIGEYHEVWGQPDVQAAHIDSNELSQWFHQAVK